MPAPSPIGVLLVNLGTPDAPEVAEVRRYLAEFLSDPRVLDIHPIGRWLLLHAIILRTRPAKSAAAYRKIWGPEGSPLLLHTRALGGAVAAALPGHVIEVAMRYGNPSLRDGLTRLQQAGCDRILVFPLYPHYAASSTGSTVEAIFREAAPLWNTPYLQVMPAFYDHPAFIDALATIGAPVIAEVDAEHVVYSFHGLPERHMRKSDPSGKHCLASASCCDRIVPANRNCYRAQCFATARALTERLGLDPARTTVCFQSRLGRTPWIQPYTDHALPALAGRGIKRVAVFCPAFVADCLETLEEIGIRAQEDWKAAGGDVLRLVPGLNAEPVWVAGVVRMIREALGEVAVG